MDKTMIKAEVGDYKGHPTITLTDISTEKHQTRICFGLAKANLILNAIAPIQEFVGRTNNPPLKHIDI